MAPERPGWAEPPAAAVACAGWRAHAEAVVSTQIDLFSFVGFSAVADIPAFAHFLAIAGVYAGAGVSAVACVPATAGYSCC